MSAAATSPPEDLPPSGDLDSLPSTSLDSGLVQYDHHVSHPPVTPQVQQQIDAFRKEVEADALYQQDVAESRHFLTDQNLHRYLRARNFDMAKSKKLILETLAWRLAYKPEYITAAFVESECNTGKIIVRPEWDRHNRPIIVMDSSRENSKSHDMQLRHLVFQLERAKRKMNGHPRQPDDRNQRTIEKYALFINMERNSIWNSPPMKTSLETLKTLTDRYPEHLGHAIIYKPGVLFAGLWAVCSKIMDPKTVRKVVFIRGDTSDGSANDAVLREVIGDRWREWCDVPKDAYSHADFWPLVLEDEKRAMETAPPPHHKPNAQASS